MVDGTDGGHRAIGHVDSIEEIGSRIGATSSIGRGAYITVRGWVLHGDQHVPVDSLRVSLESEAPIAAFLGLPRPDVAERFGPAALNAGFVVVLPVTTAYGQHRLAFEARSHDEALSFDWDRAVSIEAPMNALIDRRERNELWAYAIDGVHFGDGTPVASFDRDVALLSFGSPAFIKLWAIDLDKRAPAERIIARSGGVYLRVIEGLMRRDAAFSVEAPAAALCGFAVPVVPALNGVESVELFALGGDNWYARLGTVRLRGTEQAPTDALPRWGQFQGSVDGIEIDGSVVSAGENIAAKVGSILIVRGWAIDEVGPRLAGGVFAAIDGRIAHEAQYGGQDRSSTLHAQGLDICGFEARIDTALLAPGRYCISLLALTARRDALGSFGKPLDLTLRDASKP